MSAQPHVRLVERLMNVFGEPKTDSPAAYMEEFGKAVKGYSAEILEQAGDEVIKSCTFWPRPAEIVQKAEAIAAQIAAKNRKPEIREEWPEPTDEQRRRASELLEHAKAAMKSDHPNKILPRADREAFLEMQRKSRNEFHLTERSRAMSGDRD